MGFLKILLVFIFCSFPWPTIQSDFETYIVHVESPDSHISTQSSLTDIESYYLSFLPKSTDISSTGNEEAASMIYSYHNVMKGFAATLTASQVKEMEKKRGFISARKQEILSVDTTHTPSFLGLQQNTGLWKDSNYGKGMIIGVVDTGITPDHPSFSDVGMPSPPAKWKGACEYSFKNKCNNKLIGARSYQGVRDSPIDENGHGTHVAGIAAGAFVNGANVYGNANGTAVGVAPLAHIAVYKVCNASGSCAESSILAGLDKAIDDGVDILSISIGLRNRTAFHKNPIALGAYSATERGILVSCSAGNRGPSIASVGNTAPWILTVGASTHNRKIKATVKLGNGEEFEGESAYQPKNSNPTFFTLFDAGKTANNQSETRYCKPGSLTDHTIRGMIVICRAGGNVSKVIKGQVVKDAGGVGMIIINKPNYGVTKSADAHVLPALDVSAADGEKILAYMHSTSNPVAAITFQGTIIGDKSAPIVAAFSSQGPSQVSHGILKPDIIGPSVNILAAWPTSVDDNKNTKSTFNIISGTSMSCPHLSGIAALRKSTHPDYHQPAVKDAGGVGMIIINQPDFGVTKSADAHVLPALDVSAADGENILAYMHSTSNPVAAITFQGTIIGDQSAPIVAAFSSRGPSVASPGILKPDIIGPGVNILAAWPTSVDDNKNTKSTFNIKSGTSMSCPHLSGVAALLKSTHPDWSPAAVKSAIMTTADTLNLANTPILDERLLPASIYATGAGHVNPSRANDPGLVYDTTFEDYIPYLCGLNYTNAEVSQLVKRNVDCSEVKSIPEAQLNYPSFSIWGLGSTPQTYTRTVTNVGVARSSYKVEIASPKGVAVEVKPSVLNFFQLNQKLTYQVTFSKIDFSPGLVIVEGFLKWTSNRHSVRSPMVVMLVSEKSAI